MCVCVKRKLIKSDKKLMQKTTTCNKQNNTKLNIFTIQQQYYNLNMLLVLLCKCNNYSYRRP